MQPIKIIKSLYKSVKEAIFSNEEIRNIAEKHPQATSFLKRRFDRTKFSGLTLTVLVISIFYVLLLLVGAIADFLTSEIIVQADSRINALVYAFRNPSAIKIFIWITILGQSPIIIFFSIITISLLWFYQKRQQILPLCISIIGSEAFTFVAKIIFHRPRPINAVLFESSKSFPSGHSTISVAFYGFLAYLIFTNSKKKSYKFLAILISLILIITIGFSRIYLRVHYLSDVWTGYLIGALWLLIAISFDQRLKKQETTPIKIRKGLTIGLVAAATIFYIGFGLIYHPSILPDPKTTPESTIISSKEIFEKYDLSRYTETLTGSTQEPISFIIIAKDDKNIISDFQFAGWQLADQVNLNTTIKTIKYAIENKEYSAAPMTPSFWNKQVHDFGFEKATNLNTVRQRHHARFWKTNFKTETGENIYVGTASLDTGIKWFITHKISPDIDTERELLFSDLQKTGSVLNFDKFKIVDPVLGKNFTGDQFFTDGKAYTIFLKKD